MSRRQIFCAFPYAPCRRDRALPQVLEVEHRGGYVYKMFLTMLWALLDLREFKGLDHRGKWQRPCRARVTPREVRGAELRRREETRFIWFYASSANERAWAETASGETN